VVVHTVVHNLWMTDVCAFTQRRHFPRTHSVHGVPAPLGRGSAAGFNLSVIRRVARADEM